MTTTEKIKQLQKEVQQLRESNQSQEKTLLDQKQLIRELNLWIEKCQSFIREKDLY